MADSDLTQNFKEDFRDFDILVGNTSEGSNGRDTFESAEETRRIPVMESKDKVQLNVFKHENDNLHNQKTNIISDVDKIRSQTKESGSKEDIPLVCCWSCSNHIPAIYEVNSNFEKFKFCPYCGTALVNASPGGNMIVNENEDKIYSQVEEEPLVCDNINELLHKDNSITSNPAKTAVLDHIQPKKTSNEPKKFVSRDKKKRKKKRSK